MQQVTKVVILKSANCLLQFKPYVYAEINVRSRAAIIYPCKCQKIKNKSEMCRLATLTFQSSFSSFPIINLIF